MQKVTPNYRKISNFVFVLALSLLLAVGVSASVHAEEISVCGSGSCCKAVDTDKGKNDSFCGSKTHPCKSVAWAISLAKSCPVNAPDKQTPGGVPKDVATREIVIVLPPTQLAAALPPCQAELGCDDDSSTTVTDWWIEQEPIPLADFFEMPATPEWLVPIVPILPDVNYLTSPVFYDAPFAIFCIVAKTARRTISVFT